ncbi:hypothetical protein ACFYZ8_26385 [Streptomyces sp. NPDC001668]|uniref:hypothetical protein n=1 Tax=unclassified Streptomyces TaxID=2593676 RepID=UPI0036AF2595
MNHHDHHDTAREEPAEHLRFAAYLSALEQVTNADEADMVSEGCCHVVGCVTA